MQQSKDQQALTEVTDGTYENARVPLDGHRYVRCHFKSCIFVYGATALFGISNNRISSDCRFEFTGAAADTILTLQAIFRMGDWGQKHVLATFQEIAPGLKTLN